MYNLEELKTRYCTIKRVPSHSWVLQDKALSYLFFMLNHVSGNRNSIREAMFTFYEITGKHDLSVFCRALGYQGGTIDQVIEDIQELGKQHNQ